MTGTALVVGASGIVGSAAAAHLAANGWRVHGLARRPVAQDGVEPVTGDLRDLAALADALHGVKPTAVFYASWIREPTEEQGIATNAAMVRNLLDAVRPAGTLAHVALVTGLKHYLGPFDAYGQGKMPPTPFRESQGRLDVPNFYYAQEDEVFAAAARDGFGWSVHRPHTIIGKAVGNAMNMGTTLAVYASICRATGAPFRFPGSPAQWESLTDMTDAELLAAHLLWATVTAEARDQDFNVVNGDVFRWQWMWARIADWFEIEPAPFDGTHRPLEPVLATQADAWRALAARHDLVEADLARLASAWHTDADLGRPFEVVTDMSKSRKLGFTGYRATDEAFFRLFERLRADRLIP